MSLSQISHFDLVTGLCRLVVEECLNGRTEIKGGWCLEEVSVNTPALFESTLFQHCFNNKIFNFATNQRQLEALPVLSLHAQQFEIFPVNSKTKRFTPVLFCVIYVSFRGLCLRTDFKFIFALNHLEIFLWSLHFQEVHILTCIPQHIFAPGALLLISQWYRNVADRNRNYAGMHIGTFS